MKTDTITLPAYWASALVNDDYSGLDDLDPAEAARCREAVRELQDEGWSIVSTVDDSERFTWSYTLYDPGANVEGGTVLDYVLLSNGAREKSDNLTIALLVDQVKNQPA